MFPTFDIPRTLTIGVPKPVPTGGVMLEARAALTGSSVPLSGSAELAPVAWSVSACRVEATGSPLASGVGALQPYTPDAKHSNTTHD
jgi:hypothetical protein